MCLWVDFFFFCGQNYLKITGTDNIVFPDKWTVCACFVNFCVVRKKVTSTAQLFKATQRHWSVYVRKAINSTQRKKKVEKKEDEKAGT